MRIYFKLQDEVGDDINALFSFLEDTELAKVTHVELDLSEIDLPSSGLMGGLYHLHLNLTRRGKALRVLGVNQRTARTLSLARLDEIVEVFESDDENKVGSDLCAD